MNRRILLLLAIYGAVVSHPALGADDFSRLNPDIKKYEFARSYIAALSYMKDIDDRWSKNVSRDAVNGASTNHQKSIIIKNTLNDLALDNSDLRVIKNYLLKYMTAPNRLMRKVADKVVVASSREIAINDEEKTLWQKWNDLIVAGQATRSKETDFVKAQYNMELQRKNFDKDIVEASALMSKVLMSDQNKNGKGHLLAITAQQRQKLLDKLDSFGGDTLDWGLKAGQRTLEGSIAVIREILEDSIWIYIDER